MFKRILARTGLVASFVLATQMAFAAPPKTDAEREAALRSLQWIEAPSFTLSASSASVRIPSGASALGSRDAATLWEVTNGTNALPGIEGVLYHEATEALVYYQKFSGGYVTMDDWDDVDPDAFIKQISDATEAANVQRRATGIPALHVVGWYEKPHLDKATSTVRWAIRAHDDGGSDNINSIALVLTRDGYEKLTWIGSPQAVTGNFLATAQAAMTFPTGSRYIDFKDGDKVAAYGVAGLVASVMGVKAAAKIGFLALLAVFLKKAGALILVPVVIILGFIKKLFKRTPAPPTPTV